MFRTSLVTGFLMLVVCGLPLPAADAPATAPATRPALKEITYSLTGGFAGRQRVLKITPAGQATLTDRFVKGSPITRQLTPEQCAELAQTFEGFDKLPIPKPASPFADAQTYSVTYGAKTLTVNDANRDAAKPDPKADALWPIIAQLDALAQTLTPQPK